MADIRTLIEQGPDALVGLRNFLQGKTQNYSARGGGIAGAAPKPTAHLLPWTGISRSRLETHQEIPKVPTIFLKLTSALTGPRSPVVLPKLTQQPDYEAEFAFVIGTGGKNISANDWEEHVFGYTIMNDVMRATCKWPRVNGLWVRVSIHSRPLAQRSSLRMKCGPTCARHQAHHRRRSLAAFEYA